MKYGQNLRSSEHIGMYGNKPFDENLHKKYSDNSLDWIDITNNDEAISLTSKTQAELLRRLHVIQDLSLIHISEPTRPY